MKIAISRKVMMEALTKGGAAALSDEAQADNCTLSLLIKSVKLTADKSITIESGTNKIYVKHTISINEESGIKVTEPGCVVVPAKEFMNFLSVQGEDAVIGLTFKKFATPEAISVPSGTLADSDVNPDGDKDKEKKIELKKVGQLVLRSKNSANSSETSGKWELDCYEEDRFTPVNFSADKEKHFEISGVKMIEALNSVIFAAMAKDYDHVLDSTSIQVYKDELYFVTTDSSRCAVYKFPKADVKEIASTRQLLIPCSLLEQVSKIIDPEDSLVFSYSEGINRVFISQSHIKIRLACTDKDKIIGFPSLEKLLTKKYRKLAELSKYTLNELLIQAALVNNSSALFTFNKDNGSIIVKAISEEGKYKPVHKQASVEGLSESISLVWAVNKLIEGMKAIKSDKIKMAIPDNLKSVRITELDNDNFTYFCMALDNPRYQIDATPAPDAS